MSTKYGENFKNAGPVLSFFPNVNDICLFSINVPQLKV